MGSKLYKCFNYVHEFSLENVYKRCDPCKVYEYNQWIYVCTGFWKLDRRPRWKSSLYNFYKSFVISVYGVSLVFFVVDAILVRNDLDKLSFNMSNTILMLVKLVQIFLLSGFKTDLDVIYEKLDNHFHVETVGKSGEDKSILKQKAETILKISFMFYCLLLTGLPIRVMADTTLGTKGYLIPIPFHENLDDYYEYVYAQQVLLSFHFMMTTLSYDLLGFSFINRFIGHYEILEKNFRKINALYPRRNFEKYVKGYVEVKRETEDGKDVLIRKTNYSEKTEKFFKKYKFGRFDILEWEDREKQREEKTYAMLKENVNHHQELLIGIRSYFNIYSQSFLIQICGMVILLGMASLQAVIVSKELSLQLLQQLLYACTTLFNMLCLCSFGSELTNKSISVTHALYDTPWYEMSTTNRNAVCLILQKLGQAPVLKGGKMITIDRVTCVKFIQSSYNMVALMRSKI